MRDVSLRGLFNQHSIIENDPANIANKNNAHYLSQIFLGNATSPSVEYLMNLGLMTLKDARSISKFNEIGYATKLSELRDLEEITDGQQINLPNPTKRIRSSLIHSMTQRRSFRSFASTPMTADQLSTLLYYSFSIVKIYDLEEKPKIFRRYASGGALYPVEVYIALGRVRDIPSQVYRYQPYSHSLFPVSSTFDISKLLPNGGFSFNTYACLFLYSFDLSRSYPKYGELALFNASVEVGNMANSVDLVAAATGLGTCQIAGFDKPYAENLLGFDGVNSHVIFSQLCGKK